MCCVLEKVRPFSRNFTCGAVLTGQDNWTRKENAISLSESYTHCYTVSTHVSERANFRLLANFLGGKNYDLVLIC